MAKRTAKEHWDALDEATVDAVIESELAMTPEERREALIKDGYDIAALEAKADAFFASRSKKAAETASPAAASPAAPPTASPKEPSAAEPAPVLAPVVPIRARKAWAPWLAAAAAVAVVGGGIGINAMLTPQPVGAAPTDRDLAEGRRGAAAENCAQKDWTTCRDLLDEAAQLDPAGDSEPRVKKLREEIAAGLVPGARDAH
jgi:hypothetical protein